MKFSRSVFFWPTHCKPVPRKVMANETDESPLIKISTANGTRRPILNSPDRIPWSLTLRVLLRCDENSRDEREEFHGVHQHVIHDRMSDDDRKCCALIAKREKKPSSRSRKQFFVAQDRAEQTREWINNWWWFVVVHREGNCSTNPSGYEQNPSRVSVYHRS